MIKETETQNQLNLKEQFLAMPILDHLDELRSRLIKCVIAIALFFFVSYTYRDNLLLLLKAPLFKFLPPDQHFLYFTGLLDELMVAIKISFYSAIALSMPFILYQFWRFISPGLKETEKKFAVPFIFSSTLFFMAGIAFGYFLVFPYGFKMLLDFGHQDKAIITLTDYFSLTTKLLLVLGLIFELPMVLGFLAKLGLLSTDTLRKHRRHAILIIAIAAAIVTPTQDAVTMTASALLLWLLYEGSIFVVALLQKKKIPDEAIST